MYLLTKSILAAMLGFISSVILGYILIPILKKMHAGQKISSYVIDRHQLKEGTPTFGGLIFIIPTLLIVFTLIITGIKITYNRSLGYFNNNIISAFTIHILTTSIFPFFTFNCFHIS